VYCEAQTRGAPRPRQYSSLSSHHSYRGYVWVISVRFYTKRNMLVCKTRTQSICAGGHFTSILAGAATASTRLPAQMAIYAGGRPPVSTDRISAGGWFRRPQGQIILQNKKKHAGPRLRRPCSWPKLVAARATRSHSSACAGLSSSPPVPVSSSRRHREPEELLDVLRH